MAMPIIVTRDLIEALEKDMHMPGIGNLLIKNFTEAGIWKLVNEELTNN